MGKDWSTTGKEVKNLKDGTLIVYNDSIGVVTQSNNEFYYMVLWNDVEDAIEVSCNVLEVNIKKGRINIVYEP